MERSERIEHITESVNDVILRLSKEYDIKVAEMIGVLEVVKMNLFKDANIMEGE